jgi:ATP:ADP antiporter, AAA family
MALFLTFIFTRLSNYLEKEKVFYAMISIFLVFFFFFTFLLYPFRDILHPHELADKLQVMLPPGCKGLIALFRNWTFTAFYVMADLWSSIVLTVLFWGFANDVTSVKEAKRFYALFGVGVNMSGIFSGQAAMYLSTNVFKPYLPYGNTAWEQSVLFLNGTVLITGILILVIYRMLNKRVIRQQRLHLPTPPKVKMSVRKNFSYIGRSKYLLCIAAIVIAYNLCINLLEVVWKNQVKQLYPNPSEYNTYMGQVMTIMGIFATATSLCISGYLIRKFSWTSVALVTPAIVLVTGIFFFSFLLFEGPWIGALATFLGATPLMLSVFFGTMQNCLTRASKYTLFDATKELSFVPLSNESKIKGKSAIDGIGSRVGKSGGSLIYQSLLMIFATISATIPVVSGIFIIVLGFWMFSVVSLGKRFTSLTAHNEKLEISENEAESGALAEQN